MHHGTVPGPRSAITDIADTAWSHILATQPYHALRVGAPIDRLPHGTLAEAAHDAAIGRQILSELSGAEAGELTTSDRDTAALLRRFAEDEWIRSEDVWWWHFPIAPYQAYLLTIYGQQVFRPFVFADGTDCERYLSLVSDLVAWLRAARDRLTMQAAAGWGLPRPALAGFVSTMRGHRTAFDSLLRVGATRTRQLSTSQRGSLSDGLERMINHKVLVGFDNVLDYLTGQAEHTAVDEVGLAQYPGGEDAYRHLVSAYSTFDIEPEEIHSLGLEHVDHLSDEMAKVRAEVGFTGGEEAYRRLLESDPRFHASTADEVEDTYRRHVASVEPLVDQWFAVTPQAKYSVKRLAPTLEAGLSYGMYEPPTQQDPVGRYRYNGSGLESRTQINAAALILHELVPGHHFHLARQSGDDHLHPVRGYLAPLMLGAYTEGWAEYAASLGFEMGVYRDPWDRYGSFVHQRFVAARLVVDTGLNLFGWSLAKARAYMARTTFESEQQIHSETLRYATDMPGQAVAYRLGFHKLWELRRRAQDVLGDAFDVRDLHEVILGPGALPLTAVERNVDQFLSTFGKSHGFNHGRAEGQERIERNWK